jgi:hypothetical protein
MAVVMERVMTMVSWCDRAGGGRADCGSAWFNTGGGRDECHCLPFLRCSRLPGNGGGEVFQRWGQRVGMAMTNCSMVIAMSVVMLQVIVVIAGLVMRVHNRWMIMVMIGRNGTGNGGDGHHPAQLVK